MDAESTCRSCGKALAVRAEPGRPGRSARYCSAACRQKAYRARRSGGGEAAGGGARSVPELIADIGRRVERLNPRPPQPFYADVSALSSVVSRLHRLARVARDAEAEAAEATEAAENVTPARVTESVTQSVTEPVTESDEVAFAEAVEPFRRELHVHCYRMSGSYDDAEDLLQETLLRAWRGRTGFRGRAALRTWLYRIATNVCLDFLRRHPRTPRPYGPSPAEPSVPMEQPPSMVAWLQPYPDELLAEIPADDPQGPDAAAVSRETLELVFLAALQHLPPRQRAVLILRDVLGRTAADTAGMLDMGVAAVNSALQRARATLRERMPGRRMDWSRPEQTSAGERAVLDRYMDAAQRADSAAMLELLAEDVLLTMPPNPLWFAGRTALSGFVGPALDPASPSFAGRWHHRHIRANGMPATAGWLQRPGTTVYRAQVIDVFRIRDGRIAEITSFEPHLFPAFGLPLTMSGAHR
ncbi:RNA polymerase sigma-70 factor, ECF subfamily [Streptomyces aidingensis]|uniref:RNA polymerase sigma factor n=1 Tax=Streptomyces aidingensis TaxID=910347 RepID=A0A1I1ECE7_9ACTN|nr:RNA polymerase sigma-70 factor, ECF subfamily [Streptomyces aidingensis]